MMNVHLTIRGDRKRLLFSRGYSGVGIALMVIISLKGIYSPSFIQPICTHQSYSCAQRSLLYFTSWRK